MDILTIAAALYLAGYATACCVWPYARCRRCSGAGKRRSPTGKYWRPCPRCEGSGKRVRLGRIVVEWFRWGSRRSE